MMDVCMIALILPWLLQLHCSPSAVYRQPSWTQCWTHFRTSWPRCLHCHRRVHCLLTQLWQRYDPSE